MKRHLWYTPWCIRQLFLISHIPFEAKEFCFKCTEINDTDKNNVDRPAILLQTNVSSPLYLPLPGPAQQLGFQAEPDVESKPVWEFSITYQKLWVVNINGGKSLSWLSAPPGGLESLDGRYLLCAAISSPIWKRKEDWLKGC